jgi:glycosyltransferase involved in cell wall biosynthesis
VSQYSKQDLVKYLHIPQDKITVVYEAADPVFHQPISQTKRHEVRHKYQLSAPYIFYVGGWEKRKNIPFLINAFAQAKLDRIDLVLAGGKSEQRDILTQLGKSLGILDRLNLLGWVDDADLPAIYAEAICFVYPSEYEGFGLQLCEAMAVGCPVLAAKASCLPEVLGDGGTLFSLENNQELVNFFRQLTRDQGYHKDLTHKAKNRSQSFNWQITAQETKNVYERILSEYKLRVS